MAAEAITPIDEIGMPLPLAPEINRNIDASQLKSDWHHHFHPRRSSILLDDFGGPAVRTSRLQFVTREAQHDEYHRYYVGPELPKTPQEKFGLVVLATAGYVPELGLSFAGSSPEEIGLSGLQRERLWKSGELRVSSPDIVRTFIMDYTLGQNLEGVKEALVDEFINTQDIQRRRYLGGVLIEMAIEKAVEPLAPFYRDAWARGCIDPRASRRPQRLIKSRMMYKRNEQKIISQLHENLIAA